VFIGDLNNSISSSETKEIPTSNQESGKDVSNTNVGDNQREDDSKGRDDCLSKTPTVSTQNTPTSKGFDDKVSGLDEDENIYSDHYNATADGEKKHQYNSSASTSDATVSDHDVLESQTKERSDVTSKTDAYSTNSAVDICKSKDESICGSSEDGAKSLHKIPESDSVELSLNQESKNTSSVDLPLSEIKVMNNSPSFNRKSNNIYTGLFSTTDMNDVDVTESAVLDLDQESNSPSINAEVLPTNEKFHEKELESNEISNATNISMRLEEDHTLSNGLEKLSSNKVKKTVSFRLDSSTDASQFTNVSLSDPECESSDGKFKYRLCAFIIYYLHYFWLLLVSFDHYHYYFSL
jgi:hypothetical protein